MRFLFVLGLFCSPLAWAQSSASFSCSVSTNLFEATFNFISTGQAELVFRTRSQAQYRCPLSLQGLDDYRRGKTNTFEFFATREEPCVKPLPPALEQGLRLKVSTVIDFKPHRPTAEILFLEGYSWHKCEISRLFMREIDLLGKKSWNPRSISNSPKRTKHIPKKLKLTIREKKR